MSFVFLIKIVQSVTTRKVNPDLRNIEVNISVKTSVSKSIPFIYQDTKIKELSCKK